MAIPVIHNLAHPRPVAEGVVPLDQVSRACDVLVVDTDGRGAARQLAQLGIRPGKVLRVHRLAPLGGPVLVESGGTTVAVGRGMACKVTVRILP